METIKYNLTSATVNKKKVWIIPYFTAVFKNDFVFF